MENSISFYFQMDKNEEFSLKSKKDFIEMGERAYNSAEEYFSIFEKCFNMIVTGKHKALCTNIAFACELYIKSLLFRECVDCRKKHDLLELYNMLPIKIKEGIKEIHPCSNSKKDRFELELKELGKAFIVFRYAYERKRLAWNMQFLIELVLTLRYYTSTVFSKNREKEELND